MVVIFRRTYVLVASLYLNFSFHSPQMDSDTLKQEQRTFLRERFLRMLGSITGRRVSVFMYENARVSGNFGPIDIDFQNVQISNLVTPMGVIPHAILRTSDIFSMKIDSLSDT